jgi:hypothetical protein
MREHGPESHSPDDVAFAAAYNDTVRFPNLTEVALELGISYQTVRNKASILKGKAKRGEDVPILISRAVVAKEREEIPPSRHAANRAALLKEDIDRLLTQSRYPVLNTGAVVVSPNLKIKYDRNTGRNEEVEDMPRTWLEGLLRVEGVTNPAGRRFLFTGAQNDSPVDPAFWTNLKAYANFLDADIVVGPGTYETQWWAENQPAVRRYAPELTDYLCFGRMELGEEFFFGGEMNMLPTASRPIGDLASYSEGKWAVFPHAKRQLKSVPSVDPDRQAHQVMTTGMVTRSKIIPRKAGIKSLAFHTLGATLVEFNMLGDVFCRQITAADNGAFYDLEFYVRDGVVTEHAGVDLLVMGDLHAAKLNDANWRAAMSIAVTLRAKRAVAHDIFDNETRNHHHVHDNAYSYELAYRGRDSVRDELAGTALLMRSITQIVPLTVVESNHDIALERYVREGRYRNDGINVRLGLQLEDAYLAARERIADAIDNGEPVPSFSLLEHAINMIAENDGITLHDVEWVHDGRSKKVNGIEIGNHGFRGSNGARGTVAGYAALGIPMTIGDKHSPEILDGVFVAGVQQLRMGYNKGPSGWAVANVIHYPDGNRTLITCQNGEWRA